MHIEEKSYLNQMEKFQTSLLHGGSILSRYCTDLFSLNKIGDQFFLSASQKFSKFHNTQLPSSLSVYQLEKLYRSIHVINYAGKFRQNQANIAPYSVGKKQKCQSYTRRYSRPTLFLWTFDRAEQRFCSIYLRNLVQKPSKIDTNRRARCSPELSTYLQMPRSKYEVRAFYSRFPRIHHRTIDTMLLYYVAGRVEDVEERY